MDTCALVEPPWQPKVPEMEPTCAIDLSMYRLPTQIHQRPEIELMAQYKKKGNVQKVDLNREFPYISQHCYKGISYMGSILEISLIFCIGV